MEFKVKNIACGQVIEIRDDWGHLVACMDPRSKEIFPVEDETCTPKFIAKAKSKVMG